MAVDLIALGGRYPLGLARYDVENIRARLFVQGDAICMRIEDTSNIDRWEMFSVDRAALLREVVEPRARQSRVAS